MPATNVVKRAGAIIATMSARGDGGSLRAGDAKA
jgi:hypothetical protein